MNTNTIIGLVGGTGRNQLITQTLASTTETEFKVGTDTVAGGAIAVLTVPQQTDVVGSFNPLDTEAGGAGLMDNYGRFGVMRGASRPGFNSSSFDYGQPFLLRLCGVATPASNSGNSLTVKLYLDTTKSGTNIATTGAVPQATTTTAKNFAIEAQLMWDSVSKAVNGQFWFGLPGTSGTVYTTWATLTSAGSGIAVSQLQFCASAQWGNAAGGAITLGEFSLSQL